MIYIPLAYNFTPVHTFLNMMSLFYSCKGENSDMFFSCSNFDITVGKYIPLGFEINEKVTEVNLSEAFLKNLEN